MAHPCLRPPPFMDPKHAAAPKGPTRHLDFSRALNDIKAGKRLAREGWIGDGMYVELHDPEKTTSTPGACQTMTLPFLCLRTSGEIGHLVPWVPSQLDMLADDWFQRA